MKGGGVGGGGGGGGREIRGDGAKRLCLNSRKVTCAHPPNVRDL